MNTYKPNCEVGKSCDPLFLDPLLIRWFDRPKKVQGLCKMNALFDPANSVAVSAWSLILGSAGLILTSLGFIISIVQIRKARNAADLAKTAVEQVQIRVSRYDAAVDLAEAKTSLQNARHYANLEAWPLFVGSYEIASEALGRVALQGSVTDARLLENIKKARGRIAKGCHAIEKHLEGAGPAPAKSELNKAIRAEMSVVQEAEQRNWKGAIS